MNPGEDKLCNEDAIHLIWYSFGERKTSPKAHLLHRAY